MGVRVFLFSSRSGCGPIRRALEAWAPQVAAKQIALTERLTPVGFVPTQIDYEDFRDVAGVKVPFQRKVSQTFMQMTVELSDVQPNVPIEAARFVRPAPVSKQ